MNKTKKGNLGETIFIETLIKKGVSKELIQQAKPKTIRQYDKKEKKFKFLKLSGDFFKLFDVIHFEDLVYFTQVKTNKTDFYSFKKKLNEFLNLIPNCIGVFQVVLIDTKKREIKDKYSINLNEIKEISNFIFKSNNYIGVKI